MKFVLWKFQKYWIFSVNRTVLGKPKYFKPIKKYQNFWKFSKKLSGKSRIFLAFGAIYFFETILNFFTFDAFVLCNMTRSYFSLCFIQDFYTYLKIIQALWPCWIICYIFPKISGSAQTFRRAELSRSLGICPSVRSISVNNHPIFILPPNLIQNLRFFGRITVLMEFPNSNIKTRGSSSMTVSMHNISIPPICVLGSIPSSNAGIN